MRVARKAERSSEADAVDGSYKRPARAWAGRGRGSRCDHCHQPIDADQIEYEIELPKGKHPQSVTVHLDCYEEWILVHYASSHGPSVSEGELS
jgi:hypothetical protein